LFEDTGGKPIAAGSVRGSKRRDMISVICDKTQIDKRLF
jgi:hypothetical protein